MSAPPPATVTAPPRPRLAFKLAAATISLLLSLGGAELLLRARPLGQLPTFVLRPRVSEMFRPCGGCSYVFTQTPGFGGEINSLGFRDREFPVEKPAGTRRILVLGDSVANGFFVNASDSFPKVLERSLDAQAPTEVINASVPSYTTHNEVELYKRVLAPYRPDLVVLQFCLNDVADPMLHWSWFLGRLPVPDDALPNPEYHREHAAPLYDDYLKYHDYLAWRSTSPLRNLALFGLLERTPLARAWMPQRAVEGGTRQYETVGGRRWPVYLVWEDSQRIDVLMRWESTEWKWLRAKLDGLKAEVEKHGARLAIVWSPMKYQLDPAYPYLPQTLFARYCQERSLPCFDPLPALRGQNPDPLFVHLGGEEMTDQWHFTAIGHRLIASELERFLEREQLLTKGQP